MTERDRWLYEFSGRALQGILSNNQSHKSLSTRARELGIGFDNAVANACVNHSIALLKVLEETVSEGRKQKAE